MRFDIPPKSSRWSDVAGGIDEAWVALRRIHDAILASNEAVSLWFTNDPITMWPRWYVEVLTAIRSAQGHGQLAYLTSSVTQVPAPSGDVYAFTRDLVIHVLVSNGSSAVANSLNGSPHVTAEVWRRSGLSQVSLLSVEPYPTDQGSFENDDPLGVEYELRYRDTVVRVPLVQFPGRQGTRSAAAAYSDFIEDLMR